MLPEEVRKQIIQRKLEEFMNGPNSLGKEG